MRALRGLVAMALVAATGCSGDADTSGGPDDARATAAATRGSPSGIEAVRRQLESDPVVHHQMLLGADGGGILRCGIDVLGRSDAGRRLYVWLSCGEYTVGPDAALGSGSGMPALVDRVRGPGWMVTGVEFPRQWRLRADHRRLFPPAVVRAIERRDVDPRPTEAEFLAQARRR